MGPCAARRRRRCRFGAEPEPTSTTTASSATSMSARACMGGTSNAVAAEIAQALARRRASRWSTTPRCLATMRRGRPTSSRLLGFAVAAADRHLPVAPGRLRQLAAGGAGFVSLPAALAGGLVAAFANGGMISLGALAGLLAILGIARATRSCCQDLPTAGADDR